ncbi:MAG: hypothetical protein ACREJQ_04520 [bacterium]
MRGHHDAPADRAHPRIHGAFSDCAKGVQGVKYIYEGGGWFLVRPATTEPILRVYLEAPSEDELPAMEREILDRLKIIESDGSQEGTGDRRHWKGASPLFHA